MSLLHLLQGNLKVAEDSYITGMEIKNVSEIQEVIHLKGKRNSAKAKKEHLGNRIARDSPSHLKG